MEKTEIFLKNSSILIKKLQSCFQTLCALWYSSKNIYVCMRTRGAHIRGNTDLYHDVFFRFGQWQMQLEGDFLFFLIGRIAWRGRVDHMCGASLDWQNYSDDTKIQCGAFERNHSRLFQTIKLSIVYKAFSSLTCRVFSEVNVEPCTGSGKPVCPYPVRLKGWAGGPKNLTGREGLSFKFIWFLHRYNNSKTKIVCLN